MASFDQKLRTLRLMEILLERTDDEHLLNASQLCAILEQEYGISTDRRTIYTEMEILDKFGLDVQQKKGKTPGYYIGARDFELPENETVYYNVDYIHTAIFENKEIRFHYAEWTIKKELKFKKDGDFYVVSPWARHLADPEGRRAFQGESACVGEPAVFRLDHGYWTGYEDRWTGRGKAAV